LLNCSLPETITAAMPTLAGVPVPFGAYANGFTSIKKLEMGDIVAESFSKRADLTPQGYANFADGWIAAGATLIGGCCEVGPEHITELSRRFGAS
jgi:S-methylmethionine-dependent homocysteine/selenocysteine methylase